MPVRAGHQKAEESFDEDEEEEEGEDGDDDNEQLDNLPKRKFDRFNRGSRYSKALDDEKAIQDKFWEHDTWAEDGQDDEWSTSDEEKYRDISDSSMDTDSNEDEEEPADVEDERAEKKRKKNVYVDPALLKKHAKKKLKGKLPVASRKKPKKLEPSRLVKSGSIESKASTSSDKFRSDDVDMDESPGRRRACRPTTQQKTLRNVEPTDPRAQKKKGASPRKEKLGKFDRELTQKEQLADAKRTEAKNIASLNQLEAEEELKQQNDIAGKGVKIWQVPHEMSITWSSWRLLPSEDTAPQNLRAPRRRRSRKSTDGAHDSDYSYESVCTSDEEAQMSAEAAELDLEDQYCREMLFFVNTPIPTNYTTRPAKPIPKTCAISGRRGIYFDPLTMQYYHDAQAFRALRQRFHDEQDAKVTASFANIEAALRRAYAAVEAHATSEL